MSEPSIDQGRELEQGNPNQFSSGSSSFQLLYKSLIIPKGEVNLSQASRLGLPRAGCGLLLWPAAQLSCQGQVRQVWLVQMDEVLQLPPCPSR